MIDAAPDKQPDFYTIRVPVNLIQYEGELFLARSKAKRLIKQFDTFLEVVLDFQGITEIGQVFADEVFRVFGNAHTGIVNSSAVPKQGFRIINRVKKNSSLHGINNGKIFLGWNNDITRII